MKIKRVLVAVGVLVLGGTAMVQVIKRTSATVTVERTFHAPVDQVWQVWNDPEALKKWWSPKDFTAPVIQNDLQVGGKFLFSMKAPDGTLSWNMGEYLEIISHQKIVSKMAFSDEKGNFVSASHYGIPGEWPDYIVMTVTFQEVDGKTNVHVKEEGIPTIMYFFSKMGWNQQFDKLELLLK